MPNWKKTVESDDDESTKALGSGVWSLDWSDDTRQNAQWNRKINNMFVQLCAFAKQVMIQKKLASSLPAGT